VAATRVTTNNDTFTATLSATPTANDYKATFGIIEDDSAPSGWGLPAGWTQAYKMGPPTSADGPESLGTYQTGSTSTTLNWAASGNLDFSPNATTAYGGFILKAGTGIQSTLKLGNGSSGNATDIIAKPSSTFQVQNTSGTALFSVNTANSTLKLGGQVTGDTVTNTQSATTGGNTYTVSSKALGYYVSVDTGTTNTGNLTNTFNITGLSDTEGSIAFISTRSTKGSTGTARTMTVNVQINGNQVGSAATSNTTSSNTGIKNFMVMYINGAWRATGSSTTDAADLAEWIPYTGDMPQEGELLTVGDDTANGSVKRSTGAYDDKLIGVVTTNPAMTFYNNDNNDSVRLTLTGRVPVKVSTENGPITAGDYLTASSTPGVAMKATKPGRMIGTALTSYNGNSIGEVMTQVQPGYATPATGSDLTDQVQGLQTAINNLGTSINSGTIQAGSLTVTGNATVGGELTVNGLSRLAGLELSGHLVTKGNTPTAALLEAAGTGTGATVTVEGNDIAGVLNVTIGNDPQGSNLLKLTFNQPYERAPRVFLTPVGKPSANLGSYLDGSTAEDFVLGVNNQAQPGASYRFYYQVIQ